MTTIKDLMDNKPKWMSDDDIAKQIVENIELFQEVKISVPKIQAVYGKPRDHTNVIIVKVNTLLS